MLSLFSFKSNIPIIFPVILKFYNSCLANMIAWHHYIAVLFHQSTWSVSVCCKTNPVLSCEELFNTHCIYVLKDRVGLYSLMDRAGQLNGVVKERQSFVFFFFFCHCWVDVMPKAKSDDKQWETPSQAVKHNGLLWFHH